MFKSYFFKQTKSTKIRILVWIFKPDKKRGKKWAKWEILKGLPHDCEQHVLVR